MEEEEEELRKDRKWCFTFRCQFYRHFMCSFYSLGSQTVFFALLGSVRVKALSKTLIKLILRRGHDKIS